MEIDGRYVEIVRCVPNSECEFRYVVVEEGGCLALEDRKVNKLVFVLKGKVKVDCGDEKANVIGEREFSLVPKGEEWRGVGVPDCRVMVLYFKKVSHVWSRKKIERLLSAYVPERAEGVPVLKGKPLLMGFLDLMSVYMQENGIGKSFFLLKDEELLCLLYVVYSEKELAGLFFPVLQADTDFKSFVLANYLKVESASGLAELAGCSLVTLNRKFKKYFHDSAYQWMMRYKTMKIQERLKNTSLPLGEIAREFGFHSSTELNRFCRRQLGATARKLRM